MCCWRTESNSQPRQQDPDFDFTYFTNGSMETITGTSECKAPSLACPKTSKFCKKGQGLCCVNDNMEFCSCFDGYTGPRCSEERFLLEASRERMDNMMDAVAITSIIFIVTAIVVMILIAVFYARSKMLKRCESCESAPEKERKTQASDNSKRQPGRSWRETSCKRQLSRTLSSSCGAVAGPAAAAPLTPISIKAGETGSPRTGQHTVANGNNNDYPVEYKTSPV